MPAWYDIASLDRPRVEDESGIRTSAGEITRLIAREVERGVPADRIVLAGFSQGGAMALFTGARHPERLAGIMVLSAYELLAHTRPAEVSGANLGTPLLMCHGLYDPMVDVARGRATFAAYASAERDAQWREFPMAHEVSPAEIAVIRDWLQARLPASR
jgi:phospholipase/carboxylesterase